MNLELLNRLDDTVDISGHWVVNPHYNGLSRRTNSHVVTVGDVFDHIVALEDREREAAEAAARLRELLGEV
jgi:hypothetical protein